MSRSKAVLLVLVAASANGLLGVKSGYRSPGPQLSAKAVVPGVAQKVPYKKGLEGPCGSY